MKTVVTLAFFVLLIAQFCVVHPMPDTFYTAEFPEYSTEKQTIQTVFTLQISVKVTIQAALSLTTVLDSSGSMSGMPIELLKRTAQFVVEKLSEDNGLHSLGIVKFNSDVETLSEVVPVNRRSSSTLNSAIDKLPASGSTALSAGLNAGVKQQAFSGQSKSRSVYLFTDGKPTRGLKLNSAIVNSLENELEKADQPVSVSTFGFGNSVDAGLLSTIADAGEGEAYFISQEEDIPAAFGKALGGLLTVVACQIEVSISVRLGCSIKSVKSGGSLFLENGVFKIRFPNLFASEFRDLLVEIELDSGVTGKQQCIETTIAFLDPGTNTRVTTEPSVLETERVAEVKTERIPTVKFEETRLKYICADALAEARTSIKKNDDEDAVQKVSVALEVVRTSVLVTSSEIQALINDMEIIIKFIGESQNTKVAIIAKIDVLYTALAMQRSISTNVEFESEKKVETEAQREGQKSAVDMVMANLSPSAPPPASDFDIIQALNDDFN